MSTCHGTRYRNMQWIRCIKVINLTGIYKMHHRSEWRGLGASFVLFSLFLLVLFLAGCGTNLESGIYNLQSAICNLQSEIVCCIIR